MLVGGDIRKINGLYTTLSFNITTSDIPPNSVLTKDIVSQYFVNIQSEANKNIGINIDPLYPITIIANYFNESVNNVLSETRKNEIVKIRDICMYILNSEFHLKLVEIGNIFSNRAHSSVIEALKRVKRKMKNDRGYTETVNSIIKRVK
jgi:chromosomal replication initiator protein